MDEPRLTSNFSTFAWGPGFSWDTRTYRVSGVASSGVTYEWFHDGVLIPATTSKELKFGPIREADAGTYSVRATAGDVTVTTNALPLSLITWISSGVVREGTQAELAFEVLGPPMTFQWMDKMGLPLPETKRFVGTQTQVLKINGMSAADIGDYYCVVDNGVDTHNVNYWQTMRGRPVMQFISTVGLEPIVWTVGQWVDGSGLIVYNHVEGEQLTISVTGLPPGINYILDTTAIIGTPTRAGTYTIKAQARNVYGLGPVSTFKVVVLPAPDKLQGNFKGTFYGLVEHDDVLNQGLGGRFTLTTAANGRYTGVMTLGASTRRFSGQIETFDDGRPPVSEIILASTPGGVPTLVLSFAMGPDVHVAGELSSTYSRVNFRAVRSPWNTMIQAVHFVGSHVVALPLDPALEGNTTYPQGTGYLEGGINLSGVFTAAARFADNTVATISTISCQDRTIPFHYLLYGGSGSVQGWAASDGQVINGDLTWIKHAQPARSKTRSYRNGFPAHRIGLAGGRRRAYTGNEIVMGLPDQASNAQFTLSLLGLDGDLTNTFRITRTNTAQMEAGSPLSLLINRSQSKFSGTVNYVGRKGACYGVFVDQLGMGVGHIQLPESTASSSPILSRKIVLGAKGEPSP
jgi:hypothetical protein